MERRASTGRLASGRKSVVRPQTDRKEKHGYCQESCEEVRGEETRREEDCCQEARSEEERRQEARRCQEERCEEASRREKNCREAQAECGVHESDAAVVGSMPIRRTVVSKKIVDFNKKNKLHDSVNRRLSNADDKLKAVFGG
jgi:chromatin remodeling complex protein RSC6